MNEGKWRIVSGEDGSRTLYLFVPGHGHAALTIVPPDEANGKDEVVIGYRNGHYVDWDADAFGELLCDLVAVSTQLEGSSQEKK